MKKFLLIFSILVLVSGIHAQDIKFMIGGSLSRYEISPETYLDFLGIEYNYEISNKTGFMIGGGIEFSLARNVFLDIDALYLQKGAEAQRIYEISIPEIGIAPQKYTLHVINIPVILKIRFLRGSSPYILGGHEWSLILSHRYNSYIDGRFLGGGSNTDSTETLESGLVYGGGFEIQLKKISFLIEARFLNGLNNIIKDAQFDWKTAKTRTIVIFAGFKI